VFENERNNETKSRRLNVRKFEIKNRSQELSDRKVESSKHLPVNCARNSTYSSVTAGERAQAHISNALVQNRDE